MAKDKTKKGGVPNKHLHARIAYLQQAATYLTIQGQGRKVKPVDSHGDDLLPVTEYNSSTGPSGSLDGAQHGETVQQERHATAEPGPANAIKVTAQPKKHSGDRIYAGGLPLHLSNHLRQVALKSQIRLHADIKRGICKTCSTVMIEGQTCGNHIENPSRGGKKQHAKVLVLECNVCGTKKRFPIGAARQKRKGERQQAPQELNSDAAEVKLQPVKNNRDCAAAAG